MKSALISIFLLCSVLTFGQVTRGYSFQVTPHSESSSDDLADIHYYFENNSADSSGNAEDATVTSMAYGSSTPAQGSYYGSFVSTSTLFKIPDSYVLGSPFSISCWVRQTNTGGYYKIMDPHNTNSDDELWFWWLDGVAYDIEFRGYQNSTNTLSRAGTANAEWSAGSTWRHVVITYDNGSMDFYYDGTDVTDDSSTWGTSDMDLDGVSLYIGQYFDGDIDDFSMYDFVLSSTQVTTLYNSGVAGKKLTE